MAESQHPFTYLATMESSFKGSLTEARLGKYLQKAGFDFTGAMRLYLWNARLSKAFQFPLHVLEVTLRNAVVEHLTTHGAPAEWAFDTPYLNRLAAANPQIRDSLNKCKSRLLFKKLGRYKSDAVIRTGNLDVPSGGVVSTDDVVASLSFEFWTMLLDGEFENEWQSSLRQVFPYAPAAASRRKLWVSSMRIKDLRNRVAHHEPIFHLADLEVIHAEILDTIGMRSQDTRHWAQHYSTVMHTIKQNGADTASADFALPYCRSLTILNDDKMPIIDVLPHLQKPRADTVLLRAGGTFRLVTPQDVVNWLSATSDIGLADLSLSLSEVGALAPSAHRVMFAGAETSLSQAGALFYARGVPTSKKPTALVLTDDGSQTGSAVGVLFKSDMPRK